MADPRTDEDSQSRPPRVWIFNHYASPPDRPAGGRHFALGRAIVKRGGEATIFAAGFSHGGFRETRVRRGALVSNQTVRGVRFVWLRTFPYRGNTWRRFVNMISYALVVVVAQARRPAPDVVVGSTVHPFAALAGWVVARARGARYFYEIRDLWPQTLIDLGAMRSGSPVARLLWMMEAFCVRRAEVVLTVLPGLEAYLESRGLPHRHVQYLPNGFDFADQGRDAETIGQPTSAGALIADVRRRQEAGEVVFVYLGAHGRVNALDVVIEGAHRAMGRFGPAFSLQLVGDGPEKPRLMEQVAQRAIANVGFHDPIPKQDVHRVLRAFDVGVVHTTYTPVYRYGVSFNKVFDYMAAGIPILFACDTAFDPVVAAGAGVSVTPDDPDRVADAIGELLAAGPEQRRAMGASGRRFAEAEHDLDRIGARFAGLVDSRWLATAAATDSRDAEATRATGLATRAIPGEAVPVGRDGTDSPA